jgi:cellulase
MECAQIQITGGGSTSPATVSFPGAYHGTFKLTLLDVIRRTMTDPYQSLFLTGSDPGITTNIYYPPVTSYTIPGPPVFSCSGGGGGGGGGTTTPPPPPPPSSTTTTTSRPTTSPSSGTVPQYGQCGGIG